MVPSNAFAEIHGGKHGEHDQRDHLLHDFELIACEMAVADPVGRYLKRVLHKQISQLTTMTFGSGASRYFKCPYHATVMKRFENVKRTAEASAGWAAIFARESMVVVAIVLGKRRRRRSPGIIADREATPWRQRDRRGRADVLLTYPAQRA